MARGSLPRWAMVGLALAGPACSVRMMAVHSMGQALAAGRFVYGRDDDPELVREAMPFALKTVESLLEVAPKDRGLLLAAASGFTEYASAFVQQEADFVQERDLAQARVLRGRARRLYLRARELGLRGLEVDIPGFRDGLRRDPPAELAKARRPQAPLLYWTALAWAGAMSLAKEDAELTADQGLAESIMRRALALDEGFDRGSIHDFFIAWEGGHAATAGSLPSAGQHLQRALALAGGRRVAPLVIYAETVSVARQDRAEFQRLLAQALEVDPDGSGEWRLSNLLSQKRARWLLSRSEELFVE